MILKPITMFFLLFASSLLSVVMKGKYDDSRVMSGEYIIGDTGYVCTKGRGRDVPQPAKGGQTMSDSIEQELIGRQVEFVVGKGVTGMIVGVSFAEGAAQYHVAWIHDGERKDAWVSKFEFRALPKGGDPQEMEVKP